MFMYSKNFKLLSISAAGRGTNNHLSINFATFRKEYDISGSIETARRKLSKEMHEYLDQQIDFINSIKFDVVKEQIFLENKYDAHKKELESKIRKFMNMPDNNFKSNERFYFMTVDRFIELKGPKIRKISPDNKSLYKKIYSEVKELLKIKSSAYNKANF